MNLDNYENDIHTELFILRANPILGKDVLFMSTRTCPPQGTLKSETKIFEYRAELLEKAKPA